MKIYVISRKGRLLDTINRKPTKTKYGTQRRTVKYKGKNYYLYSMSGTNLSGYAIYPYGTGRK